MESEKTLGKQTKLAFSLQIMSTLSEKINLPQQEEVFLFLFWTSSKAGILHTQGQTIIYSRFLDIFSFFFHCKCFMLRVGLPCCAVYFSESQVFNNWHLFGCDGSLFSSPVRWVWCFHWTSLRITTIKQHFVLVNTVTCFYYGDIRL